MKIFRWRRDQDCRAARVEMLDRRRAGVKFAREEKARTRIIRGAAAPFAWPLYVIKMASCVMNCAAGRSEKPLHGRFWPRVFGFYLRALSVIACVQAPLGLAVITGSDPPSIKVATVRS